MDPSPRSTVRRIPELARYDAETVAAVLDAGLVAHVGISYQGAPVVIPMAYGRVGDTLYIHGSTASRMMRALKTGDAICITVTVIDGIVLARSAFNMSMNYRAVVVHGHARLVTDPDERMTAFRSVMEQVVPGHWDAVRPPNDVELRQTLVTAIKLDEVSAKVSSGPPGDDEADLALPIWGGEIPLRTVAGAPIADEHVRDGVAAPASVTGYARVSGPRSLGRLHQLRSIGRGRTLQLVAVVVCALALIGVGTRYFWVRHERRHTEQTIVTLTRQTTAALALLHRVTDTRALADEHNTTVQTQRDGARTLAAALHADLDQTRADTTTAEVGAFTSGAEANNLAACLAGVSQALNQLAVGDGGAISSLQAVDAQCRMAGIT